MTRTDEIARRHRTRGHVILHSATRRTDHKRANIASFRQPRLPRHTHGEFRNHINKILLKPSNPHGYLKVWNINPLYSIFIHCTYVCYVLLNYIYLVLTYLLTYLYYYVFFWIIKSICLSSHDSTCTDLRLSVTFLPSPVDIRLTLWQIAK